MQDDRSIDLAKYRLDTADETLEVAKECFDKKHYKDAINRSYYAAFYAARAVLALEGVDYKRHKDVIAHFNQYYVATEKLPKEIGRKLAGLQQKREQSDYDDFFIASVEEAQKQYENSKMIVECIKTYLNI